MSYGLDNYVNNKVSAPVLLFLTVLQLDVKKKETWFPIVFISTLGRYGRKKPVGRFFIYFLLVMVYACYQYSWLQLNIF